MRQVNPNPFDFSASVNMVLHCRNSVKDLNPEQKYAHVMSLFQSTVHNLTELKHNIGTFVLFSSVYIASVHDIHAGTIGVSTRIEHKFLLPTSQILGAHKIEVCKTAFCRAYGISHWTLNQMAVRLKKNEDSHSLEFNDRSGSISSLREAESIGQRHNLVPALTVEVSSFFHCTGN